MVMTLTRNCPRNSNLRPRRQNQNKSPKKNEWNVYYSRMKLGVMIGIISTILIFQITKLNEYANSISDNVPDEDAWHIVQGATKETKKVRSPAVKQINNKIKAIPVENSKSGIKVEDRRIGALSFRIHSPHDDDKTTIGLCALMRNDKEYIQEWIDYYLGIGFDTIYIYDNTEKNVLKNIVGENNRVEIIHWWPQNNANQDIKSRQNCLNTKGTKHGWMAFFHGNEFLVLKKDENITNILSSEQYKHTSTLVLNRYVFGPSTKSNYEPFPVTLRFMYRGSSLHTRIKSIVNMNVFRKRKETKHFLDAEELNVPLHIAVVNQYTKTSFENIKYGCPPEDKIITSRCPPERKDDVFDDSAWQLLKKNVPSYSEYETEYKEYVDRPTAAMCVLMKAEELYVDEWVDYNIGLGFSNIYIYDNSDKNTMQEWGEAKEGVDIIHWPGVKKQHRAQEHCMTKLPKHTWMALFDGDEFLVLKKHENVVDFLEEYCKRGSVAINWSIFGTGNKTVYEPLPVTKRFLYRERRISNTIKSIVRMEDFDPDQKITNPHSFPIREGANQHDTDFKSNFSDKGAANRLGGPTDVAVLHHYRYKSLEEWRYKGCVRKMAADSDKQCNWPAVNGSVYDDSAWVTLKKNVPRYREYDDL